MILNISIAIILVTSELLVQSYFVQSDNMSVVNAVVPYHQQNNVFSTFLFLHFETLF
ncbi:hypothetical protein GYN67_08320 [Lactococcus piscium]|uniref:hypothetical protein n=1 Tax=Pseudolactococcus carnosus TaxID=2749961 RepID=UPI001FB8B968|nr:hypothetical protein [Lactococcus carnosus]MCJ1996695.1 hypothetical protein [Lactococcus carnosus]